MFTRKMIYIMTIVVLGLISTGARATQYYVSTDGSDLNTGLSWAQAFATVGEAIDTASDDDVIDVNEGDYTGTLDFDGKAITIRSTDPNDWDVVADTEITATAVIFLSGEEANSVLLGCTVDGVIDCDGSGPTIRQCIITGGIECTGGSGATIENNKITAGLNKGIVVDSSTGQIRNNWIYDSDEGILLYQITAPVTISNNTIVDNSDYGIRALSCTAPNIPNISNCIIWDNYDDLDGCTATYSCIEDCTDATGTGNICGDGNDPLFAGWMVDPYYLAYNSPCIDQGDPYGTYTGQTDIEGDNRVVDGRIDMGADEFIEFLPPFGCENESGEVESIDIGDANDDDPNYTGGIIWTSTGISDPCTDPNDGTITYRELLAGKKLYINFPAFNLDDGYDPNDPNDPNSLPLTEMLLEVMYRDTIDVNDLLTYAPAQVFVISKIDYIDIDPNYLKSERFYGLTNLGGSDDGSWKYSQYGFKKSDFQLIRAIDGYFTIEIRNSTVVNLPIDYVSLRKITPEQYDALFDKQREARCFYEIELPSDAPASPSYDDPNMVIFSRDIMRPVYQHTQPGENEPNSISGFGVWGQVEPLSFSIYSQGGTNELDISICDLQHTDGNTISSGDITISRVIYDEKRFNYTNKKSYALLPERLEELADSETFFVDVNTSQRVWLKIDVPDNSGDTLPSGLYEGTVTVDPAGGDPNITIDIEFTVYDINLLLPEHINTVYSDPFTTVYSSDLDEVFKAYRETGFDPFMSTGTHRIIVTGDANNLVFDSNNFEAALDRMVEEGHAVDKLCRSIREFAAVYNAVMPSRYDATDPNLYYNLSDSNFVAGIEELLGVYKNIADSYDPNLEFIFHVSDEPSYVPYRRILCDRVYTIIRECNKPNANNLKTGVTYKSDCDEPLDPDIYNVPEGNIPPLTDLVDYKLWTHSNYGTGYANHQDPNYHGYFGYYTTGESQYPNPVYNRFLHGLFPFVTDAWGVAAYTMWNKESDPYNDFDTEYRFRFPFAYPSFIFAYPTWSGELHSRIGGLEGIREGIKDASYIATLRDLIDDDPSAPVAIEAQDYIDEIKSRISTNYNTGYMSKRTDLGYYRAIVEDVSEDGDPNDFEAFTEIRKNFADYIVLLDSGIDYKVHNIEQDTWYTTITGAIAGAVNGDTLVAYPDTYSGTLDFDGKAIILSSTDPNDWDVVADTVITVTGVLFESGEDSDSVLVGCTIDGYIDCDGSSPIIKKCIITEGIECTGDSDATIKNNKISNSSGHGVHISSSAGEIKNNWIYDCSSNGIRFFSATAEVEVSNNTIVDNVSYGIRVAGNGADPNITNCILWNNDDDLHVCSATYSCIENCNDASGVGNICGDANDPCFVDAATNDFHLGPASPCINAGDPNKTGDGETDIDGDQRVIRTIVDIGADEVQRVYNTVQKLWYYDIQPAIDDANDSDTLVVYQDTYTEPGPVSYIYFDGKAITISGSDPNDWDVVEETVITSTVFFTSGEDANSVLTGCTVNGAIVCQVSGPTVRRCIITKGIDLSSGSSAVIENNKISYPSGFGIFIDSSAGLIRNNWIYDCSNGIFFYNATAAVDVINNTIVDNSDYGIRVVGSGSAPNITNCILWYNDVNDLVGCTATYSCIEDCNEASGTGNICGDANYPLFDDPNNYDYHIDVNSPCIDAGDPNGTYTGQVDIDFEERVDGNDVDMGADECH